jgi:hypothetical protein
VNAQLLLVGLLVLLVAANLAVSVAITRSGMYEKRQVLAQLAIVWLAPVVGVVFVGLFLRSQRDNPMFDTRAYPERDEKALGAELDTSQHH